MRKNGLITQTFTIFQKMCNVAILLYSFWLFCSVLCQKRFEFTFCQNKYMCDWIAKNMKGFQDNLFWSLIFTFSVYFGTGAFFHVYYYKIQHGSADKWKCQPHKWLPPHLELHEIALGSFNTFWGSALCAALTTYVINGGKGSLIYFQPSEFGYLWLIFQVPVTFVFMDYLYYWHHRLYHLPALYKRFHKIHHKYKQPTSFAVVAFHPFEQFTEHFILFSPVFLVPVYWANLLVVFLYMYIHGILEHSGINFTNLWWQPWQSDTKFHDIHHEFTHFNFGFNVDYWDKLHGTFRGKPEKV